MTILIPTGMEWDNVMVLDERMKCLNTYKFDEKNSSNYYGKPKVMINHESWTDDIHLWYVAVTRAKKSLAIPRELSRILNFWASLDHWGSMGYQEHKKGTKHVQEKAFVQLSENQILINDESWSMEEAKLIHKDIVEPACREIISRNGIEVDKNWYFQKSTQKKKKKRRKKAKSF